MKILLGDFNAKEGRENISKLTIRNNGSHKISYSNGVIVVNFATSKNLVVNSTVFPHSNIHKYTCTFPGGKTHNQTDHVLINRREHSNLLHVGSFSGAHCYTNHFFIVAKVRKKLAVDK
jgi:endonuclease/exonuclease/phosphatase family metal-dependent hydrolase